MNTDTAPVSKLLYTPEEAAQALGISRSKLYVLLAAGDIASVQVGRSRRVRVATLERFVDSLGVDSLGVDRLAAGHGETP